MKKLILLFAGATILFAGCAKGEPEEVIPTPEQGKRTVTLKATVNEPKTKVSATIEGDKATFSWQAGDKIAVWIDDSGSGSLKQNITTQNTGATADFPVTLDSDEELGPYAFYPSSMGCAVDGNAVTFGMNSNITYVKDATNMPMLGTISSTGATFVAVGAVIKLTINNVPQDAAHLLFSAKGENNSKLTITGAFPVSNGQITAGGQEGGDVVTIDFSNNRENNMDFYIPIPTGTYYGFDITFTTASSTNILGATKKVQFGSDGLVVERNDIIVTPATTMLAVAWYESFNTNGEIGGNDGTWDAGSSANALSDYQWVFERANAANHCIKFGTSNNGGSALSPVLRVNGTASIAFKAGAWDGTSEKTTLLLEVVGEGTLNTSSVTLTKGEFNDYSVKITGSKPSSKIKFYTDNGKNRVFLDEVFVKANESDIRDPKTDPDLHFSSETATAVVGAPFTAPTLSKPSNLDVVFSSTNTNVATVDPNTGAVSILTIGTTTIKATSEETSDYEADEASYELTVFSSGSLILVIQGAQTQISGAIGQPISELLPADPQCTVTGYTFTGWSSTEYATIQTAEPTYVATSTTLPAEGMILYAVFAKATQTQVQQNNVTYNTDDFSGRGVNGGGPNSSFTHTEDGLSIAFTNAYETTGHVRIYETSSIMFSSKRTISHIVFTCNSSYGADRLSLSSTSDGTYTGENGTWDKVSTSPNDVTFDVNKQVRATSIVVTLAAGTITTYYDWTTSPVA